MNANGIRADDLVEIDVRGWRGFARVTHPIRLDPELQRRVLHIEPLKESGYLPTRFITARQVVGHYSKRGRTNGKAH